MKGNIKIKMLYLSETILIDIVGRDEYTCIEGKHGGFHYLEQMEEYDKLETNDPFKLLSLLKNNSKNTLGKINYQTRGELNTFIYIYSSLHFSFLHSLPVVFFLQL